MADHPVVLVVMITVLHAKPMLGSTMNKRREPNNVQCFKNGDCISDCCISNNGWVGVCVGRPLVGQICGLFTASPQMPGNMKAWSQTGALSNLMGNMNGPGAAGAQAAAALARSRTKGFGLAYGANQPNLATAAGSNLNSHSQRVGRLPYGNNQNQSSSGGMRTGIIPAPRNSQMRLAMDPFHKYYPQDSRILAYQQAGGYGSYGSNTNYYGFGAGRN